MSEQTNEPTVDVIVVEDSEPSFASQLMKTSAVNAAATAGTLVGLVAVGLTVDKIRDLREKRAAKKAAQSATPETSAPAE